MKQLNPKNTFEILLGVGISAIVFGAVWIALEFRFAPEPPGLPLSIDTAASTVLSEPMTVPPFMLTDHRGSSFTENNLRGYWTFLFFGYTYCPDICPMTLTILNQVDKFLQEQKTLQHPQFIFVSIDPNRDTSKGLADYVAYFNPTFIGVTGLDEQLQALTRPLGIFYQRATGANYLVDHSATILLVNPQVQLQALISPPHDAAAIADDYQKIVNAVGQQQ